MRLGRAIKYLERAESQGLIPLCLDRTNANIAIALGSQLFPPTATVGDIADMAVSFSSINEASLEVELEKLSWAEVLKLRKEVIPSVAELRTIVLRRLPNSRETIGLLLHNIKRKSLGCAMNWRQQRS
jgi:hypothetical protein